MNGIERAPGEAVPGFKGPRVANLQDLADRVAATPFTNQPGETWTYGIAIDVLGRVVEVASGQSLGTFFSERIFTPLGMKHTAFQVQPGGQENLANVYFAVSKVKPATGGIDSYVRSLKDVPVHEALRPGDPPAKSPFLAPARIEFGGAGLVGTLSDYVRFARMIAGQGELDGVRILKAASIAEMGKDQLGPKANANLVKQGYSYGLGFGTVLDSNLYPTGAPVGTMFWGGAAGTQFWANPQTKEAGVLMTQVLGDYLRTYQVNAARAANGLPVQ
jgi:CubicO group peptidase (beta-lactamase class C family)